MSQCWQSKVHLATIEKFVLEDLGVLRGAAVNVTKVKWKTFRSSGDESLFTKLSMLMKEVWRYTIPILERDCW